jgi:hypothetical protein
MKLAVFNDFLCSPATVLENSLDDTKQVCQVWTPSAECCSKSKFSPLGKLGVNIKFSGNSQKSSARFFQQPAKQFLVLVSPTPPSGCQAQGVDVSKNKYDMQYGKVNNNAIK